MKLRIAVLISIVASTFSACQEQQQDTNESSATYIENVPTEPALEDARMAGVSNKALEYNVFDKVKSETNNKAQILVYAFLTKDLNTKSEIEGFLSDIYEKNKNEAGYKGFSKPTVVGAYIFSSKKLAQQDKSAWTGMLIKGPGDIEPRISINDLKLKSQNGLKDNKKSEDEIALDLLNKSLSKKGLELCSFNKKLSDIELDCIHKADKKYPDFGTKHMEYVDKLTEVEMNKIRKKYHLNNDIFTKVSVFAGVYCK